MGIATLSHSAAMNGKGRAGLDMSLILSHGIALAEAELDDGWHSQSEDKWYWHASQLSGCPREAILRRAGLANDGMTVQGALTFQIGHLYHRLFEKGAPEMEANDPLFRVIALESGGFHPTLPLAARCDILFEYDGQIILGDYKTESPFAKDKRNREAKAKDLEFPYRWEHHIQMTATAMVMSSLYPEMPPIEEARLLYIDKSSGNVDQVPCRISYADRQLVGELVNELEAHWKRYEDDGTLPQPLRAADEVWRCKPRSATDSRGEWCQARSTCFLRREQGNVVGGDVLLRAVPGGNDAAVSSGGIAASR